MHQENTGSSQQAQVCCLFILNSNSSSKDRELKDNSHLFNYLYCYFKTDTFKGSLSLPLYFLTSPPSGFKDFIFKGLVSKLRGSSLGRGFSKGLGVVLSELTTREDIGTGVKTRRPHKRDYEPNSAVFPLKFTLSWSKLSCIGT